MNKAVTISNREAHYKVQAERSLAEAQQILRDLAAERRRGERQRATRPSVLEEVKAILRKS